MYCEERQNDAQELMGNFTDSIQENSLNLDNNLREEVENQEYVYQLGENAYAECIKINNNIYHFYCLDRKSHFFWKKDIVDRYSSGLKEGDGLWVNLKELVDEKHCVYKAFGIKPNSLYLEFKNFYKYHKKGDIINAPIANVDSDFISVCIGPTAEVRIYFRDLPAYINVGSIKNNQIRKFKITELQENENQIIVRLSIVEDRFYRDKKNWMKLPDCIHDRRKVTVYAKFLEHIKENEDVCEKIFGDKEPDIETLISKLDERYQKALDQKQINIQVNKKTMYMDFDLGIKDKKGVPQSACFKKKEGETWTLCLVGFASAERLLERYVYISDWRKMLNEVSEMALGDEDWDYKGRGKDDKYILKQYLLFDFYKSWIDNLIIQEGGEALFNTGLVDSSYDDIYCYLKKNTHNDDFYQRKWEFGYFACRAKGNNGKKLMAKFEKFPSAPTYVDVNRISDLYFNSSKELFCDYEHIIEDNLTRLPIEFLRSKLCYDAEIDQAISDYETSHERKYFQKIIDMVNGRDDRGDRFRRDLQNGLKDAVDTARKYCKWNYKTAIPIYYPRNNSISLLLPLKLQANHNSQADVALVVERLQNGNYQGQTILTLEMAYQDARQICRPNSEWLTLSNIVESDAEEDE